MPQNFSGRSMAYTRYTKAATLNNKDRIVMASTYTRSHKVTNPIRAPNVTRARTIIPRVNIARSFGFHARKRISSSPL
jgi:hypothetical protein